LNHHDDIKRHLQTLFEPGDVFEVRAPKTLQRRGSSFRATCSGYYTYDAIDKAAADIAELDDSGMAPGIYVTMNPVAEGLLARSINKLTPQAVSTTGDNDIVTRRWLVIDVDPVRPSNVSATDKELEYARQFAQRLIDESGWPEPMVIESGNGIHLYFRVDLPADDEEIIKERLKLIADAYDDDRCKVDRTMFNASRITKVAGTMARKGEHLVDVPGIEDRPHRPARVVSVPSEMEFIELSAAPKVTTTSHMPHTGGLDGSPEGTRQWLTDHGVTVKGEKQTSQGTLLYLEVCPVTGTVSESPSDIAVGVAHDGTLSYHNLHNRGVDTKWADVREVLDPKPVSQPEPEEGPTQLIPEWMPFPTDAFPEPICEYIKEAAKAQMLNEASIAVPMLASLAGAVNAARYVQVKPGWKEPCIVWSCIVMRSGDGKSHALDSAIEPLEEWETAENNRFDVDTRDYEQACALKPDEDHEEPRPIRRIMASDVTIEGLAALLADNHRGIFMPRDELAGWFGSFDRYARSAGGDRPFWLSAHGGRPHMIDRKTTKPMRIPSCAVSITGTIQPKIIEAMVSDQDRESGLMARMLVAYPPTPIQQWSEEFVPEAMKARVQAIFNFLLELDRVEYPDESSQPVIIPFSPAAKKTWIKWFNSAKFRQRESQTDDHAANWSKQIGYAARLALLFELVMRAEENTSGPYNALRLALAQHGGSVRREALKAAIRVMEWFVHESDRIFQRNNAPETTKELIKLKEWVERRGGRCTVREVYSSLRRYKGNKAQAEQDLEGMVTEGLGKWEFREREQGQSGRPSKEFMLS